VEARLGIVAASCHGVAATKEHGGVVRPSQLIASVRPLEGEEEVDETRASVTGGRRGRVGCRECALERGGAEMVRVARDWTEWPEAILAVGERCEGAVGSSAGGGSRGAVARPSQPVRTHGVWRGLTSGIWTPSVK